MRLEDQVCSLELAKKLKELGVKQEGAFYWIGKLPFDGLGKRYYELERGFLPNDDDVCSAFTVAELGEMLPPFWMCKEPNDAYVGRCNREPHVGAFSEAEFRAKMLIHLIEKGIVKP